MNEFEVGEIVYCIVGTNVIKVKMIMWDNHYQTHGPKKAYVKTLQGGLFTIEQSKISKITDFTRALYE